MLAPISLIYQLSNFKKWEENEVREDYHGNCLQFWFYERETEIAEEHNSELSWFEKLINFFEWSLLSMIWRSSEGLSRISHLDLYLMIYRYLIAPSKLTILSILAKFIIQSRLDLVAQINLFWKLTVFIRLLTSETKTAKHKLFHRNQENKRT